LIVWDGSMATFDFAATVPPRQVTVFNSHTNSWEISYS
jgi:hypothetical protein